MEFGRNQKPGFKPTHKAGIYTEAPTDPIFHEPVSVAGWFIRRIFRNNHEGVPIRSRRGKLSSRSVAIAVRETLDSKLGLEQDRHGSWYKISNNVRLAVKKKERKHNAFQNLRAKPTVKIDNILHKHYTGKTIPQHEVSAGESTLYGEIKREDLPKLFPDVDHRWWNSIKPQVAFFVPYTKRDGKELELKKPAKFSSNGYPQLGLMLEPVQNIDNPGEQGHMIYLNPSECSDEQLAILEKLSEDILEKTRNLSLQLEELARSRT